MDNMCITAIYSGSFLETMVSSTCRTTNGFHIFTAVFLKSLFLLKPGNCTIGKLAFQDDVNFFLVVKKLSYKPHQALDPVRPL